MEQSTNSKMAAPPENDATGWFIKVAYLIFSSIVGFGAKVALLSKDGKLTSSILFRNAFIAALAVWVTYNTCKLYGVSESGIYIYVALSARFADAVILLLFQALKNLVNKFGD